LYKIPAKTLFMGHSLVFMPECHSTNDEASRLIQTTNVMDGTVVVTENQTAGRGQRGNTWTSEPGKNLTFSILLKPTFLQVHDQFYLNIAFSLGLHDYLSEVVESQVNIKWPNDILVNEKKICGILIENHLRGQHIQHTIVGIGLNVNQEFYPLASATSMKLETKEDFNLEEALADLLSSLEIRFIQLRSNQLQKLLSDYLDVLYRKGEQHPFKNGDETFLGTISGIDPTGKLKIETESGLRSFGVKEVEFIK
jgi:BirA family transcriptional regulator, biotin operon repressor / biotin---[acetyl-CoA-carboxylase] ligase